MSAVVLLLVGLAIGWWVSKARIWIDEVKSSRLKIVRYRKERNRSIKMTALFVAVLVVLIIGFAQGG
jgi:hypothetical protein